MSIRMRHTSSHKKQRRSHHALRPVSVSKCPKCGKEKLPHTLCANCGFYKNREVLNVLKKITKKGKKEKSKNKIK